MVFFTQKNMRLNRQLAALSTLLVAAGMLAGTAWTRDPSRVVNYTCPGGEQFTVEYLRGHIRLRTGAGVFALASQSAEGGERYSDGQTVFSLTGAQAQLERPGLPRSSGCSARNTAT